ncbi:MAG: hypothetical protein WBQ34_08335 [Candidatus Acidiferrales bacterium]
MIRTCLFITCLIVTGPGGSFGFRQDPASRPQDLDATDFEEGAAALIVRISTEQAVSAAHILRDNKANTSEKEKYRVPSAGSNSAMWVL